MKNKPYEQLYYEKDEIWHLDFEASKDELSRAKNLLNLIPKFTKTILDIGSGNGFIVKKIEELKKYKITAVDRSKAAIKNKICKTPIKQMSIEQLPTAKKYDLVMATEVLEHLPILTFSEAIKKMCAISSRYILISVPLEEKRFFQICPSCNVTFNPDYHLRTFKRNNMKDLFPNFSLIKSSIIYKKKIFFRYLLNFTLKNYLFNKKVIKINSLCPMCGFTNSKSKSNNTSSEVMSKYMRFIPKTKQPEWIICLYQKNVRGNQKAN